MSGLELAATPQLAVDRRPRLASLRARLIASHVFVILLAMALVLVISAGFLRRNEEQAEIERLRELAEPLAVEAGTFPLLNSDPERVRLRLANVLNDQADQLDVRLLLIQVDDAQVIFDTDESLSLRGQRLTAYIEPITTVASNDRGRLDIASVVADPRDNDPLAGNRLVFAAGGQSRIALAIAAPPDRFPLVRRFLPTLILVVAISLAIASIAGLLFSRRIAAPINQLAEAADAMASGKLDQRVTGGGGDELGRLVASFNTMSHKVAETNRIQREFLATIAHELRTPLTSIQGYAQALRDGAVEADQDVDRALATISRESDRMASLIRQLLDLARLESGQARLDMAPIDVAPLFTRIVERFAIEADRREITLQADAPPNLRLIGDDERLVQLLSNLVANALRHTPAGGLVALTGAPVASVDGSSIPRVRLSVHDTGEGILPDRLPRIFDRFERGEDANDGFGLGLAIVKELMQLHGGTISVQSRHGVGTTFDVDLPGA